MRTLGGVRYVRGASRANSVLFGAVDNPTVFGPTTHRSRSPWCLRCVRRPDRVRVWRLPNVLSAIVRARRRVSSSSYLCWSRTFSSRKRNSLFRRADANGRAIYRIITGAWKYINVQRYPSLLSVSITMINIELIFPFRDERKKNV